MQADVRVAFSDARIGFAGPAVILNTMCEADQDKFDNQCPADFQSSSYVLEHGQIDVVLEVDAHSNAAQMQAKVLQLVAKVAALLMSNMPPAQESSSTLTAAAVSDADRSQPFNYTKSRQIDRPQTQDIIANLFGSFVELR